MIGRRLTIFSAAALAAILSLSPLFAAPETAGGLAAAPEQAARQASAAEARHTETVAPGIEHLVIRRGDFEGAGDRWIIHVLLCDPGRVRLALGQALDEVLGAETVSSICARRGALAAVNGGYFRTTGLYRGEPAGLVALDGEILSETDRRRPSLAGGHPDGRARLAVATVVSRLEIVTGRGARRALSGVNRARGAHELILFTPEFHRTTLTGPNGWETALEDGRVAGGRDGAGSMVIPPNGFVLSAAGAARAWAREHLPAGETVTITSDLSADPPLPFEPDFLLGGGPILLRRSAAAHRDDPGVFAANFTAQRHPRTAAGVRDDGTIVLVTVDGRQPASAGMTIPELAELMARLGCTDAMNLDGGGSTTMAIRGKVANSPSDPGGERAVADALLVFSR